MEPPQCCGNCTGEPFCSSKSGNCYTQKKKSYYANCWLQLRWEPDLGKCLSVDHDIFENGRRMQTWDCDESGARFSVNTTLQAHADWIRAAHKDWMPSGTFVVSVKNDAPTNGTRVVLSRIDVDNLKQKWIVEPVGRSYSQVMLKSNANRSQCMVVKDKNAFDGQRVEIRSCSSAGSNAIWQLSY